MPTKTAVRQAYERIADSFAPTRVEPWPEVLEFIEALPSSARAADIGCGNGRHMKALVAQGHRAVGVDFSRRLLGLGGREVPNVAWIEADAVTLPLRDGSFDAVLCIAVLHHLPTPEDRIAALREVGRILRDRGRAIVSVWDRDQPRFADTAIDARGDATIPWTLPDGTLVGRYYHLFRAGELEGLIIASGLHGERFFHRAGNRFALVTKRGGRLGSH